MESGFHLAKWYFDCISAEGAMAIGYAARLRWKKLSFHYSSIITGKERNTFSSDSSLSPTEFPILQNSTIEWTSTALSVSGTWQRTFPPIERTLLENDHGFIRWSCVMPGAEARMHIGNEEIHGTGYVEFLEMTIPPWKLPIDQLRWGRYVTAADAVVWIDWQGPHPLRHLFHNGKEILCNELDDAVIASHASSLQLTLDRSTIVRNGALMQTTLKKIPLIDRIIPKTLLHTKECKWLSRATLFVDGQPSQNGFAIHELVRFK